MINALFGLVIWVAKLVFLIAIATWIYGLVFRRSSACSGFFDSFGRGCSRVKETLSSPVICRAFGIPVVVDPSSLFLVLLFVLDSGLAVGFMLALLLGVSIVVHELAHSLVAKAFGCRIAEIRLSVIGGCASGEIPEEPWKEFLVAAAGPVSSFALAFAADFCLNADVWSFRAAMLLGYFYIMNMMLGLFNLLPGFPMDGGRIFRCVMCLFESRERATWHAMAIGRVAAVALLVLPEMGVKSIWFIPIGGSFLIRALIAWMIWREGKREYLIARDRAMWSSVRYTARVSPPPYGGKEDDLDVEKNR